MTASDLDTPKYPQRVVAAVSGVQPKTIQTWVNRGIVSTKDSGLGTGHRRLYSARDVVCFVVLGRLQRLGLVGSPASEIADEIRARCESIVGHRSNLNPKRNRELYLFVSPLMGDHIESFRPDAVAGAQVDRFLIRYGAPGGSMLAQLTADTITGCQLLRQDAGLFMNVGQVVETTIEILGDAGIGKSALLTSIPEERDAARRQTTGSGDRAKGRRRFVP